MRLDESTKELRAFIDESLKERDMSGYDLAMAFLKYKDEHKTGDMTFSKVTSIIVAVSRYLNELLDQGKVKILKEEESRATIKRKIWRWVG